MKNLSNLILVLFLAGFSVSAYVVGTVILDDLQSKKILENPGVIIVMIFYLGIIGLVIGAVDLLRSTGFFAKKPN